MDRHPYPQNRKLLNIYLTVEEEHNMSSPDIFRENIQYQNLTVTPLQKIPEDITPSESETLLITLHELWLKRLSAQDANAIPDPSDDSPTTIE